MPKKMYKMGQEEDIEILEHCDNNESSNCVLNCQSIIDNLKAKYSPPRDCVMSEWTEWSECKDCGWGKSKRTRKILSQPKKGGKSCGHLEEEKKCIKKTCLDNKFKFYPL